MAFPCQCNTILEMLSAAFLYSSSHPFRSLTFCPSFKTRSNKMVLMIHSHEYLLSAVCGVEVLHCPSIPGSSHLCSGSFIWSKWFPRNSFGSGFRKESFPTKLFQFFWCCIFYIFHIQDLNHSFYSSLIIYCIKKADNSCVHCTEVISLISGFESLRGRTSFPFSFVKIAYFLFCVNFKSL